MPLNSRLRTFFANHVVLAGYLLSTLGIITLVTISYVTYSEEERSDRWVRHTLDALGRLEKLHLKIVQAESSGRGYLVTLNPDFLVMFHALAPAVDDAIREFREFTSDNPRQQKLAGELEDLVHRRFAFLETQVRLRRNGAEMGRIIEIARRGALEMQSIEAVADRMRAEEQSLMSARVADLRSRQERVTFLLLVSGAVGVIILTIVFRFTSVVWAAKRKAEETALQLAHHDALTGLPNRRLLIDRLTTGLAHARRQQKMLALLSLDLDGFKTVNDTHGHPAGDELLQQVAGRLRAAVRAVDTVARPGGDEFAVLLFEATEQGSAQVASKIIEAVQQPFALAGATVNVGTSIGIALFPTHGDNPDALFSRADEALYEAKRAGKGRYEVAAI